MVAAIWTLPDAVLWVSVGMRCGDSDAMRVVQCFSLMLHGQRDCVRHRAVPCDFFSLEIGIAGLKLELHFAYLKLDLHT